nr:hypothetical protein [Tanacetum cinerariifolium]
MTPINDTGIFSNAYDDEAVEEEVDMNNVVSSYTIPDALLTKFLKDHPKDQVIGSIETHVQTRQMTKINKEHGLISSIQKLMRTNHKDFQNCLFACYLSQIEPKKPVQALKDPSWVEAMQNKKDEKGIVIKIKARLVAQGHTQEEGIEHDEVFTPVARIEAVRLFLSYASFKDFVVYQIDVKSAFLDGKIEEEVYVCQPPGFEDPNFLDKVYKVEKALYGIHQASRAWYKTLSTYLMYNGFHKGQIDKTLFIKIHIDDILLVQVYVDDIIFGSTMKELIQQKSDGIFISQDKYVADILKKFDFSTIKTTSTLMEPNKALVKDAEAEDVDVHLYRSMIGSLMYLTASRPDITFSFCAYARMMIAKDGICFMDIFVVKTGNSSLNTAGKRSRKTMKRDATTASSLEAEQDSGGAEAQTRFEVASKQSNYPPLSRVHTLRSGEDIIKLKGIDGILYKTDSTQEKKCNPMRKKIVWVLRRMHPNRGVEDIDQDAEIALVDKAQGRMHDADMFGVDDLEGNEVIVDVRDKIVEKEVSTADSVTTAGEVVTAASVEDSVAPTTATTADVNDELTLAMTLIEIKAAKPKVISTAITTPRAKEQESAKKQKLAEQKQAKVADDDTAELKRCLKIVPEDDDDVAIKATLLSSKSPTIVDYKIYKEGKKSYFKIIKADGNSQNYLTFGAMFKNFNREDLEVLRSIVKERFKKTKPVDDIENLLFQTLKTMFEPHVEDIIWKYQQGAVKVNNWKLFDSCRVYCVTTKNMVYYLLVEKMHPFTNNVLHQ